MAKAVAWACGYLLALAWDYAGLLVASGGFVSPGGTEGDDELRGGSMVALLLMIALPPLLAWAMRGSSRRAIRGFTAGLWAGTFMVIAWFVLIVISLVAWIGFFLPLWHPVLLAIFFLAPPLWFGWIVWIHASVCPLSRSQTSSIGARRRTCTLRAFI